MGLFLISHEILKTNGNDFLLKKKFDGNICCGCTSKKKRPIRKTKKLNGVEFGNTYERQKYYL